MKQKRKDDLNPPPANLRHELAFALRKANKKTHFLYHTKENNDATPSPTLKELTTAIREAMQETEADEPVY